MNGPTLTLVGHDASRTGAPRLQLTLVRWLVERGVDTRTVLLRGGPLAADFAAVAPCGVMDSIWSRGVQAAGAGLASVGVGSGAPELSVHPTLLRQRRTDVVVANTLASLPAARSMVRFMRPTPRLVCHVHELDGVAAQVLPRSSSERADLLDSTDRFVAAGSSVAAMLVGRLGIDASRVHVVDSFVERPPARGDQQRRSDSEAGAGIGRGEGGGPLILSVGSLTRRKGPERFVDLMALLAQHPRRPHGVWLGGDPDGALAAEIRADISRSGLDGSTTVVGDVDDAQRWMRRASVVVSTAVEDPFPLVALEAAALGVPVAGFDSGGIADLLRAAGSDDLLVEVGDLFALGERVGGLLDDPRLRFELGQRMQDWVLDTHTVERLGPRWLEAVTR